ncbi:MAG: hypothetical protein QOG84_2858, partial [Sphingomonadales bacterium]|nr:hypothetical protein [Sphingomonadales bacterium]
MRPILIAAALAGASLFAAPAVADPLSDQVRADLPSLMAIYRDLHANPELSMEETRSAGILAGEARKAGFEVTTGVGKTGVVAVMRNGPGPVLLLRTDMDALPVIENTDLPFRSTVHTTYEGHDVGVAHACGHDIHTSVELGVAAMLASVRAELPGTVIFV